MIPNITKKNVLSTKAVSNVITCSSCNDSFIKDLSPYFFKGPLKKISLLFKTKPKNKIISKDDKWNDLPTAYSNNNTANIKKYFACIFNCWNKTTNK